ncbi:putative reverse transcriptase domain-containing protein [Tanacetum coccineum]|uniref:Reverse transcriptase domain-containing protein n=1 Tax=Tanacetum coccineum TaxID=301880 RepID=A0ABQ4Y3V7_9ASTR
MSKWNINWTRSCSDVVAFACVIFSLLLEGLLQLNAPAGRPLGAYDLGVATLRVLVYAGVMTSDDARSWVMTRSAGRPASAPQGRGTGGRVGRGGRRVREPRRRNVEPADELEGQGNDQGVEVNEDDVRKVIENNNHRGCTYKEFLSCNPKEYDGKGIAIVYTRWIEKMEPVQDMSRCRENQKVKYTVGLFIGKALTWWNSQIHTQRREAAIGMSWEDFKNLTREEFCPSNEMQKLETELWNHAMVGAGHAAYTDRFHELARLVLHLVTLENKRIQRNESIKKNPENRGNEGEPSKDRNVRDDNKRYRTVSAFAMTLFDFRVEYSFVSTAFTPLLCIEPSDLGFSYEIEIASGQLVEIDKVIKGCKLEIEGHEFDINLIQFRSGSFDVIIGIDWLSNHKAEIIYHEKVVRITLPDGKVLRVIGERLEEKEIEFRIELVPGTILVAKSPDRLAPSEMKELSGQLKEL